MFTDRVADTGEIFALKRNGYEAIALNRLANPGNLAQQLELFSQLYPGCNRAAVTSQWSMDYLSVLLPGIITPALTLNIAIVCWEPGVELLHNDAKPAALKILPQQPLLHADQWPWFAQCLIQDHIEPVLLGLSRVGGIAPKVLWNNFVAVWDGCFERLRGSLPDRNDLENAHRWLEQSTVCNGKISLRKLQRWVDSPAPELRTQIPLRKHCCLHYQLHAPVEGQFPVWCESCPKLHRRPVEEQARYLRELYLENLEYDA